MAVWAIGGRFGHPNGGIYTARIGFVVALCPERWRGLLPNNTCNCARAGVGEDDAAFSFDAGLTITMHSAR